MHLVQGDTLAGGLRQGIETDNLLIFKDNLLYGPVLPIDQNDRCFRERLTFWRSFLNKEFGDGYNDYLLLKRLKKRLFSDERFYIWYQNHISGKLYCLWLINTLTTFDPDIHQITVFRLGIEQYAAIFNRQTSSMDIDQGQRLEKSDLKEIIDMWRNITSNDPGELSRLSITKSREAFFDQTSLQECLYMYPYPNSGLNQTQYRLLKIINEKESIQGSGAFIEFIKKYGSEPWSHSEYCIYSLRPLLPNRAKYPLLNVEGDDKNILSAKLSITDFGIKSLEGGFNHVMNNGVDTWILGKHLKYPGNRVWYFDGKHVIKGKQ
jgi:hypothetical protein